MDLYHESYDHFSQMINKKNASIFEIACGPGNITKYLLNKHPEYRILGIDLSEKMVELAKGNNPKADFKVMDCREISEIDQKFDGIMCGFCLPYLSKIDSIKLIRDVAGLLNPDGILYLSTMEGEYDKSGYEGPSFGEGDQVFIHYHEEEYLTKALYKNGFNLLRLKRQAYPEVDGSFTTDLILIAKMKI